MTITEYMKHKKEEECECTCGQCVRRKYSRGWSSAWFLTNHKRGRWLSDQIDAELKPYGGSEPLVFAVEIRTNGPLNTAYRRYMACRLWRERVNGRPKLKHGECTFVTATVERTNRIALEMLRVIREN